MTDAGRLLLFVCILNTTLGFKVIGRPINKITIWCFTCLGIELAAELTIELDLRFGYIKIKQFFFAQP